MFQSNTFAATLALCFSSLSSTMFADESVQLDVFRGGESQAKEVVRAWSSIQEKSDEGRQRSIKLEKVLAPLADDDDRVFLVWTGIERNVPPSALITELYKVNKPEWSFALQPTDFSPANWEKVSDDDVVELRTYVMTPGNLSAIHARFRDHTISLFERHGMKNIQYYKLFDDESSTVSQILQAFSPKMQESIDASAEVNSADKILVYFLAHKSKEAGLASFTAFRNDPDWIKARTESEKQAGGSLTVGNGVKSLYLKTIRQ